MVGWFQAALLAVAVALGGAGAAMPGAAVGAPVRMGDDLSGLRVVAWLKDGGDRRFVLGTVKNGYFSGSVEPVFKGDYRLYAVCPAGMDCPTFQMDEAETDVEGRTRSRKPGGFVFHISPGRRNDAYFSGRLSVTNQPTPLEGDLIVRPSWDELASADLQETMMDEAGAWRAAPAELILFCVVGAKGELKACRTQGGKTPSAAQAAVTAQMRHAPVLTNGRLAEGLRVRVRFVTAP